MKTALQFAVNRSHTKIEEKDIISAEKQYSRFALDSLLVELGPRVPRIEEFLFEFVGSVEIITADDVRRAMVAAGLLEDMVTELIDMLIEVTFLGPGSRA